MTKKNVGIERLRLVSMYFIVILHIMGAGGILEELVPMTKEYVGAWFLEMLALCGVNIYCLISGYVAKEGGIRISRLLQLWIQVVFYTLLITLIFHAFTDIEVTKRDWLHAILPITTGQYWYISCYFGMFFLLPVINAGVQRMELKTLRNCLLGVLGLYTLLPVALNQDPFVLKSGYSVLWMVVLYLLGAYFQKSQMVERISAVKGMVIALLSLMASWGGRIGIEALTLRVFGEIKYGYVLASYTSPFMVLTAVGLFFAFVSRKKQSEETMKVSIGKRLMKSTSLASLGVYLIHTHPLVFQHCIQGKATFLAKEGVGVLLLSVLFIAFVLWIGCLFVDLLRIGIFRLLKVKALCEALEKKVTGQW